MGTQGWGKQICLEPTGILCICREATLHQRPAWQPDSDDAQLHSDCSGNEITPDASRPRAEPGARDSRPRERRNLPKVSHPPQIPSHLVTPPDIPHDPGLAAGPWYLDFPLPKPSLPPAFSWRVSTFTRASVQVPPPQWPALDSPS